MKMKKSGFFVLLTVLILLLCQCQKENESENYDANLDVARSSTLANSIFSNVYKVFHQAFYDTVLHSAGSKDICGANVMYLTYPGDSVVIRAVYPDWNLLCPDGIYRRGIINAWIKEPFTDSSGKAEFNFTNFATENNELTGDYEILYETDSNQKPLYKSVAKEVEISMFDSVNSMQWEAHQKVFWAEGSETPQDFSDDLFLYSGTNSGVSESGLPFSSEIVEPIKKDRLCTWLKGGSFIVRSPDLNVGEGMVYFTEDSCNDLFYMEFQGIQFYERFKYLYIQKPL